MAKGIVNDLLDTPRGLQVDLGALLQALRAPPGPGGRRAWRWIKVFWVLGLVVALGATLFRGAVADFIASTPHPALVYTIFLVAAVAAALCAALLAAILREYEWFERFRDLPADGRDAMIATRDPASVLTPLFELVVRTREFSVGQRKQALDHELDSAEATLLGRAALPTLLSGSLVGIGLVGTFVGLLGTLHDLSGVFSAFSSVGGDGASTFSTMIQKLRGPIQGMGTAFVASLYGLLGSLVIGLVVLSVRRIGEDMFAGLRLYVSDEIYIGGHLSTDPIQGESELSASMRILAAVTREEHGKLRDGMGQWSQVLDERLAKVAAVTASIGAEVQESADYVGSAARRAADSLEKARETNERLFFGMNEVSKGLIERLDRLNTELAAAGGRQQMRMALVALGLALFAVGAALGSILSSRSDAAPRAPVPQVETPQARVPQPVDTEPLPVPISGPAEPPLQPSLAPPGAAEAGQRPGPRVVAQRGDTLSGLARRHGVALDALVAANPQIRNTDAVQIGEDVWLPQR